MELSSDDDDVDIEEQDGDWEDKNQEDSNEEVSLQNARSLPPSRLSLHPSK